MDGGTWLVLSSRLPKMPEEGALGMDFSVKTSPSSPPPPHPLSPPPVSTGTGIAEGWGTGPASLWPKVGRAACSAPCCPAKATAPHNSALSPGWAWKCCPRPPAHKGPIVWLRLWAAGGCPVPHEEALPPAAQAEEGTEGTSRVGGMGGPDRARVQHTQGQGCSMKGPILPALALPSRHGQHAARWPSPGTQMPTLWSGQWLGLQTQGSPGDFPEAVRRRSRKWPRKPTGQQEGLA